MSRAGKRLVIFVCAALGFGLVGVRSTRAHDADRDDAWQGFDWRVVRGFEIAPVKLDLKGKNRVLVGRGSYIVNAQGGCNDCHTKQPYDPANGPYVTPAVKWRVNPEGYLAGGQRFGPFVSANITPDSQGLPAGLTWKAFKETIRTGHNPNDPKGEILQVMPWPVFRNMIDEDLRAIYEYLTAIPSQPTGTPN